MNRNSALALLAALFLSTPASGQDGNAAMVEGTGVVLRGLDKMSSKVVEFTLGIGQTAAFERLEIRADACLYVEGDIEDEAVALLEIRDIRESEARFQGWMFASSPALSALDHPRYDVWVIRCTSS